MISPVSSVKNYNNVNFGSIERTVEKNGKLLYRNNTFFFRSDIPWEALLKYMASRDYQKPKIYCYACSDGSEPYSIAMGLIKHLGKEGAKKFFPIIARDIDKTMISNAKNKVISMDALDFNIISQNVGRTSARKYFGNPTWSYLNLHSNFPVDLELANCVNFDIGDITKDFEKLDYSEAFVFCRNVWPYIREFDAKKVMKGFAEKFTPTTTLVLGDFDFRSLNSQVFGYANMRTLLEEFKDFRCIGSNLYVKNNANAPKSIYNPLYEKYLKKCHIIL